MYNIDTKTLKKCQNSRMIELLNKKSIKLSFKYYSFTS